MRRENWSQASGARRPRSAVRAARWGFLALALALPLCAQAPAPAPAAPPAAPPPAAPAPAPGQQAASPAPAAPAAPPNATPSPVQPPVGEAPLATQIDQAKMGIEPPPPPPPETDWLSGYVDVGYRWVTGPGGNFQEYRSVVNLGEGPKLFGADFTIQDPKKRLFDVLTVRGIGWGGDPYTTAFVEARKQKLYDFRFDYRNIALFDAVPSFANPNSPLGFDEQTFDTRRRDASFELDLFPASRIVPYLAYDRYSGGGNGIDDWVVGAGNNFPVPFLTHDLTHNYRGGVHFELNRFHLTLEQGGSTFLENDSTNVTGQFPGDNPSSGDTLTSLQQAYGIRGSSIYTKALLTANPFKWINFYGQFLYSEPKNTVNYTELSGGSFVNFATLMQYGAEYGLSTGNVVQPHIGGLGGFQMYLGKRVRVIETVTFNREHDSAFSSFDTQFLQSLTTPSLLSASLTLANPFQVVNNQETETDLYYDVTKYLTLRGGFRYMWGNATVVASTLSETGPFTTGSLSRIVGIGGGILRLGQKLRVTADYEGSSSDDIYFRTSLNDYSKGRVMAKYQATNSLMFTANFQVLSNQNPSPHRPTRFSRPRQFAGLLLDPQGGQAHHLHRRIRPLHHARQYPLSKPAHLRHRRFLLPRQRAHRHRRHGGRAAARGQADRGRLAFHFERQPPHQLLRAQCTASNAREQALGVGYRVAVLWLRRKLLPVRGLSLAHRANRHQAEPVRRPACSHSSPPYPLSVGAASVSERS